MMSAQSKKHAAVSDSSGLSLKGRIPGQAEVLGFLIIVGFELLGMELHRVGAPLPGGVIGLLLFTFALAAGLVKVEWVEKTATFLVRHMTLLFIPMMVGLPQMSAELRAEGVALLASSVISLFAVLLTTGGLAHIFLRDAATAEVVGKK